MGRAAVRKKTLPVIKYNELESFVHCRVNNGTNIAMYVLVVVRIVQINAKNKEQD